MFLKFFIPSYFLPVVTLNLYYLYLHALNDLKKLMNKKILLLLIASITGAAAIAQNRENDYLTFQKKLPVSFLFSETTLTPEDLSWSMDYSASYGERVSGPFGSEGVGQQFGVKGYLGRKFTLVANAAIGFPHKNDVSTAQQAEIIRDFIGGQKKHGLRVGAGLGLSRDYSSVASLISRVTVSYDAASWKAGGNILVEKAFAGNRDKIDVITSLGFHYRLLKNFYGGLETVGEDLEGFWDKEEAEGGAKLMAGPSLNMTSDNSRISFSVSGGPVIYATQSPVSNQVAIRELPTRSGLTLRAKFIFKLSQ